MPTKIRLTPIPIVEEAPGHRRTPALNRGDLVRITLEGQLRRTADGYYNFEMRDPETGSAITLNNSQLVMARNLIRVTEYEVDDEGNEVNLPAQQEPTPFLRRREFPIDPVPFDDDLDDLLGDTEAESTW